MGWRACSRTPPLARGCSSSSFSRLSAGARFALGLVTLALSQYVLPERLYPWLTLASGLMVVAVGATVLRSRLRARRKHGHHHHAHEAELSWRGLVGMGASAGLIPCPSALVVLPGAIA